MELLIATLAHGIRLLDENGRLTSEPGPPDLLGAHRSLFVVDLEMSGSNPQLHEVLDLGGIRATLARPLAEEAVWGGRVKPRHIGNAIPGALKVVGYSSKGWKDALELNIAFAQFAEVGRGAIITGWGIGQDIAFLVESCRRQGIAWPFAPMAIDVQHIARFILKGGGDVDRFNLGHVADRLGIGRMGEHGALADAYATYDVLSRLLERATQLNGGAAAPA